jgi:hypothetical protein
MIMTFRSDSYFSLDPEQTSFNQHITERFLEQEKIAKTPQTHRVKACLENALHLISDEDYEAAQQEIHDALEFL